MGREGLGEGPGPNDPTSVTQQTEKGKVHLDGSGSGVRGAILTLWCNWSSWSNAPGSRGTKVRPLILRLAGTDGHEAHSSRGERLARFGIWFDIPGIHGCFGETFQVGPGRRWLNCGVPGSRSKCSFPELFKWREFRIFFKFDLWEDFMAWRSGKAGEGLEPWPSV